jgi:hypothetical protein
MLALEISTLHVGVVIVNLFVSGTFVGTYSEGQEG